MTSTIVHSESGQASLSRHLVVIWLVGTLVLLPLEFIKLPLNMTLVDCWIIMALPVFWLSFVRGPQVVSFSYTIAMWFILLGSFASTLGAPAPKNSLIVILKEGYAYIWFVTLTAVLITLNRRDFRRILAVWTAMVLLHGFVIVGQFLSPDFWQFILSFSEKSSEFDIYRPSGLFMNPNSAAFFQVLGFVPLVLVSPSRKVGMFLAVLLLPTVLVTGSMAATVAFVAGLTVAAIAVSLSGHLGLLIKSAVYFTTAIAILSGLFYLVVSHNPRYQEHLERITVGRAEKSSESRFDLWQRGADVMLERRILLRGIGPENFRVVDGQDNQLHNDFLAFLVERGLLSTLGLVLFAGLAISRAGYMVLLSTKYPGQAQLVVVVFLAACVAALVESLTHQTFHFREMWLVLAFQEAMLLKMMTSESGVEPTADRLHAPRGHRGGYVAQPDFTGG